MPSNYPYVRVELLAGSGLSITARKSENSRLADPSFGVVFEFNGVHVFVKDGDTAADIVANYETGVDVQRRLKALHVDVPTVDKKLYIPT